MTKAERLLGIASDSSRMVDFNDTLSYMVNSEVKKGKMLSDDELMMVAGGASGESAADNQKERLKKLLGII